MDTVEVFVRLGFAALAGVALGLNRDLRGKPTGVRTLGLVGLASAVAVLAVAHGEPNNVGRVIQGIVTGIGFIGGGVILRREDPKGVHGLSTAASIWIVAAAGVASGCGLWRSAVASVLIALLLLVGGGVIDRALHTRGPDDDDPTL